MGFFLIIIVVIGWYVIDKVIELCLVVMKVDEDVELVFDLGFFIVIELKVFCYVGWVMVVGIVLLVVVVWFENFVLCLFDGEIIVFIVLIMKLIVLLIFFLFIILGIVYGCVVGIFKNSNDVIKVMLVIMFIMGVYIVMLFFCV